MHLPGDDYIATIIRVAMAGARSTGSPHVFPAALQWVTGWAEYRAVLRTPESRSMNRLACIAALLACAGVTMYGCDDTPAPPPHLLEDKPATQEAPKVVRPTTQELLTGPRQTIRLGELPLTAQAPASWAVKPMPATDHVLLQGPTPSGDVVVQLNERPITKGTTLEFLVNGAKKEQQQSPDTVKMVELRPIRGAKVLERQRVGLTPLPSPEDPPGTKLSPPLSWTITVFVPQGEDYGTFELNFIGLTVEQYETDKALLRGIIDSLALDAVAASATPPTTTAAPAAGAP
jgi:hypothetical protein